MPMLAAPRPAVAQRGQQPPASPPINAATDPLLRGLRWRSIGPVGQGGRVDDIAVVERNTSIFYVGFATGGLWKTANNGVTFEPIFDTYSTHSIGDIAIAQSNPDIVYVGTGEPNNRQSSSFGDGVFKTTDGGKTFVNTGLRETQTIARIVVHPTNPDIVWVASPGHLFGPNPERGVFKSTDGGRTWTKVLYVDENTGATDLVIHPRNPNVLFAATYTRRRTSCCFVAGGPGDGIWRSTDGGVRWTRVTGGGLPSGTMGRIALDFSRSNPNVIYAQIEVAPDKLPPVAADVQTAQAGGRGGGGGGGRGGENLPPDPESSGIWRSADGGRTWEFRSNENQRPMYFSQLRVDPNNENTIYVGGVQAMKSTDGGRTFTELQGMGHVDHHAIWIDPNNSQHVMYGNDGSVDKSYDGGATWESLRTWAVGQPYHASVDMRRPYYVCTGLQDNGSWCGPSSVRSGPILLQDWYRVGGGDGFQSQVDPSDWTVLYTESQGGNMSRLDLRNGTSVAIRPLDGGRGGRGGFADVPVGPAGPAGGPPPNVVPAPPPGVQYRFNWQTPIVMSPHDPSTLFVGANRLFISRDRGRTWTASPDLTKEVDRDQRAFIGLKVGLPGCSRLRVGACILSRNDGVSQYSTIETISESPIVPGLIWVGTDDGNIQVTRDGGATWTEVGKNVPGGTKEYYVSRVEASHFDAATAYASLDGHRHDDLRPYVYVTRDYGQTWTSITANLPERGNVNSVKEDLRNRNLLFVATEFGFYASLDGGRAWKALMTNLPVVRVDDVLIHPRENDLVLSTHGRSVWIMDDISALQQLTPAAQQQEVVLFEPRNAVLWKNDIRLSRSVTGAKNFRGENAPPGTAISYYLRNAPSGDVRITIRDLETNQVFRTIEGTRLAGMNRVQWNLCSDPRPLAAAGGRGGGGGFGGGGGGCGAGGRGGGGGAAAQGQQMVAQMANPGSYMVTLTVGGRDYSKSVTVLEDVWMFER
jgi:photosystem II stability/assembly factor-like uncharacterized protein